MSGAKGWRVVYGETRPAWERVLPTKREADAFARKAVEPTGASSRTRAVSATNERDVTISQMADVAARTDIKTLALTDAITRIGSNKTLAENPDINFILGSLTGKIPIFGGAPGNFEKIGQAARDNGLRVTAVTVMPDVAHDCISSDPAARAGLPQLRDPARFQAQAGLGIVRTVHDGEAEARLFLHEGVAVDRALLPLLEPLLPHHRRMLLNSIPTLDSIPEWHIAISEKEARSQTRAGRFARLLHWNKR